MFQQNCEGISKFALTCQTYSKNMKNYILLFVISIFSVSAIFADSTIKVRKQIEWYETPIIHNPTGNFPTEILAFDDALYNPVHPSLPYFSERRPVESAGKVSVNLINVQYEPFTKAPSEDDRFLSEELNINTKVYNDRGQYYLYFFFIPIRKTASGQYERVTAFELELNFTSVPTARPRNDYTYNSVLEEGDVYKISVTSSGVHKIDYDFLKNSLDLNIDNVDPRKIKLYGQHGGMLPELVDAERVDDLEELAIVIQGESDGSFDNGDYILFYAEGATKWHFDPATNTFKQPNNVYSSKNYYYLKVESTDGLRLSDKSSMNETVYTTSTFDSYTRFEEDRFNLLNEASGTQGSGKDWYGDIFNPTRERSYSFAFPNLITSEPAHVVIKFAGRTKTSSIFTATVQGQNFSKTISNINWTNTESLYARVAKVSETINLNSPDVEVTLQYPAVGDGTNLGWVDYIEFNVRRELTKISSQLAFRDQKTLNYASTTFRVRGVDGNTEVWDITNPLSNPKSSSLPLMVPNYNLGQRPPTIYENSSLSKEMEIYLLPKLLRMDEPLPIRTITALTTSIW